MIFDNDLNEKNFLLYAMKEYNNPQCIDIEEFNDDLRKIKYIKRLFNQYASEGVLKERLLLNPRGIRGFSSSAPGISAQVGSSSSAASG